MSRVTLHEDVIPGAIREAVAKIVSGIDLESAKGICRENISLATVDGVDIRDACLCAHEGRQAVQVKLGFTGILNLVLDFTGNCISVVPEHAPEAASPDRKMDAASTQAAQAHQEF